MYSEDHLLPISALQHLLFCERQCALIHIERVWAENYLTVQGHHLHQKAHQGLLETRGHVRIARGLDLHSFHLGLVGKADVVEFHLNPDVGPSVVPIEYKRGRPKKEPSDRVQLCAQGLCLEEMLDLHIPAGELFYGRRRRRTPVAFDDALRQLTIQTTERLHELIGSAQTPRARREPKCDRCSLFDLCMPGVTGLQRSATRVIDRHFAAVLHSADV